MGRINKFQVFLGCLTLLSGALLYLSDRPPDATYFVSRFLSALSISGFHGNLFGRLDANLASFLHVFSFILITAGLAAESKKGHMAVCLFWCAVNIVFEAGQHFDALAAGIVPQWFENYILLEAVDDYFIYGCFDPLDVTAVFAGAAAGYVVLRKTGKKKRGKQYVF